MEASEMDLGGEGATPGDDPFGDVPPDPLLGGDPPVEPGEPGSPTNPIDLSGDEAGGLPGEDPSAEPPLSEEDAEAIMEQEQIAAAEAEQQALGEADDPVPPTPVEDPISEAEEAVAPLPEPTPEPDPEPEPEAAKPKGKSETRQYHVLEKTGEDQFTLRTTVEAHNGDGALRKAYRAIEKPSADAEVTLAVIAESHWKPRPVRGRPTTNVAIDIG